MSRAKAVSHVPALAHELLVAISPSSTPFGGVHRPRREMATAPNRTAKAIRRKKMEHGLKKKAAQQQLIEKTGKTDVEYHRLKQEVEELKRANEERLKDMIKIMKENAKSANKEIGNADPSGILAEERRKALRQRIHKVISSISSVSSGVWDMRVDLSQAGVTGVLQAMEFVHKTSTGKPSARARGGPPPPHNNILSASPGKSSRAIPDAVDDDEMDEESLIPFDEDTIAQIVQDTTSSEPYTAMSVHGREMNAFTRAELAYSIFSIGQLPQTRNNVRDCEVIFAGRSNVGKSSLLNALTESNLAKTSKKPGKTQSLNYYALSPNALARRKYIAHFLAAKYPADLDADNEFISTLSPKLQIRPSKVQKQGLQKLQETHGDRPWLALVDMPGYGYARAPLSAVDEWNALIGAYIKLRTPKRLRALSDKIAYGVTPEIEEKILQKLGTNLATPGDNSQASDHHKEDLTPPVANMTGDSTSPQQGQLTKAMIKNAWKRYYKTQRSPPESIHFPASTYGRELLAASEGGNVKVALLLIDSNVGLTKHDYEFLMFLDHYRIRTQIILTKIDKCKPIKLLQTIQGIQQAIFPQFVDHTSDTTTTATTSHDDTQANVEEEEYEVVLSKPSRHYSVPEAKEKRQRSHSRLPDHRQDNTSDVTTDSSNDMFSTRQGKKAMQGTDDYSLTKSNGGMDNDKTDYPKTRTVNSTTLEGAKVSPKQSNHVDGEDASKGANEASVGEDEDGQPTQSSRRRRVRSSASLSSLHSASSKPSTLFAKKADSPQTDSYKSNENDEKDKGTENGMKGQHSATRRNEVAPESVSTRKSSKNGKGKEPSLVIGSWGDDIINRDLNEKKWMKVNKANESDEPSHQPKNRGRNGEDEEERDDEYDNDDEDDYADLNREVQVLELKYVSPFILTVSSKNKEHIGTLRKAILAACI